MKPTNMNGARRAANLDPKARRLNVRITGYLVYGDFFTLISPQHWKELEYKLIGYKTFEENKCGSFKQVMTQIASVLNIRAEIVHRIVTGKTRKYLYELECEGLEEPDETLRQNGSHCRDIRVFS